jgi:PAS domain S-box-containing protein
MNGDTPPDTLGHTSAAAGFPDRVAALGVALLSALVLAVVAPMAGERWAVVPAFIPAYQSAVAINDLVTAALLFALHRETRRGPILLLAAGYLYTAPLVIAHALSFPGLFGPEGLIGGPQTTVWLWLAWHGPFPVIVLGYAMLAGSANDRPSHKGAATAAVVLPLVLAGLAVYLATVLHEHLPVLLDNNGYIAGVTRPVLAIPLVASLLTLAVLAARTRLRSALDLWLAVAMGAWAVEILLSAVLNSGRFQAGFYVGRLYGLLASCTVLVSLLLATAGLHGRLARALVGERDKARAALHASEARYRLLVESAHGFAIITLSPDGTITGWNAGAEALMGYPEVEAIGQPGAVLFTREDRAAGVPEDELRSAEEHGRAENERWHLRRDGTRFWGSGLVMPLADGGGFVKIFRDRTVEHRATERLREGEERFRALVEASAQVFWATAADGRVIEDSPSWRAYTGQGVAEWLGFGWLDAVHPADRERVEAVWRRSAEDGSRYEVEYRLYHAGSEAHRWTLARGVPLRRPDGGVRGWVGMNTDIHNRRAAEERQSLLAREVDHRAKNALAVVQSVLRLTRAPDQRAYALAVEGRVAALARAHTLLARERWAGARLQVVLAQELAPFAGPAGHEAAIAVRTELEGPDLLLPAIVAQPLSMAAHELATNAAKYGALSMPGGRVRVSWQRDPDSSLRLRWEERGGPTVPSPPRRRGFGMGVLDATIRGQLGGKIGFEWASEGLTCEVLVPGNRLVESTWPWITSSAPAEPAATWAEPAAGALERRSRPDTATGWTRQRVLIVEDEALVALDTAATIAALGYEVVGPAANFDEALHLAAATPPPDAAVLDLNLGGEASMSIADLLVARGVPVVFATGYADLPEDARRHALAPLLRKPVSAIELGAALRKFLSADAPPR